MLTNKRNSQDGHQKRVRPADQKLIDVNTKRGKASNRKGIVYGAREAGRSPDHFKVDGSSKPSAARGMSKKGSTLKKAPPQRKNDGQKEQRMTSG